MIKCSSLNIKMKVDNVIMEQEEEPRTMVFYKQLAPLDEDEVNQAKYMLSCVGTHYMDETHNTLLHQSALTVSPFAVYVYANAGVPVNIRNTEGNTALHLAVKTGNTDIVRALLQCGANPKIRNQMGLMAVDLADNRTKPLCDLFEPGLVCALEKGNFTALKRLLSLHVSMDTVVKDGFTGLELASAVSEESGRHQKCYQYAVLPHLPTNRLVHGIKVRDLGLVKQLLETGKANVNTRYKNRLGRPPLVLAIERNDADMVQLLLQYGARVKTRFCVDESSPSIPLPHLVVSRRSCPVDIVKAVVSQSENYITEKDTRGFTLLHRAIVSKSCQATIRFLCEAHGGALLHTRDALGRLPRELAQIMTNDDVVEIIDKVVSGLPISKLLVMMVNFYGVKNFNFTDQKLVEMAQTCEEKGRTQIEAAGRGDADTVISLINGDYRDQHGLTSLTRAIACNRLEVVEAILTHKQRLKIIPDNCNRYPLHYAYALPEVIGAPFIQLLLEQDGEVIERLHDKDGYLPADYITRRDSPDIQEMLHRARSLSY